MALQEADYAAVWQLGDEYRASDPRMIAIRYSPGDRVPDSNTYLCDGTAVGCPHSAALRSGQVFPELPKECVGSKWRPRRRPARG
jgi:hypothetical protein